MATTTAVAFLRNGDLGCCWQAAGYGDALDASSMAKHQASL
jgi:hypothetical protein